MRNTGKVRENSGNLVFIMSHVGEFFVKFVDIGLIGLSGLKWVFIDHVHSTGKGIVFTVFVRLRDTRVRTTNC